jgi:hypothetical protein
MFVGMLCFKHSVALCPSFTGTPVRKTEILTEKHVMPRSIKVHINYCRRDGIWTLRHGRAGEPFVWTV